MLYSTLLFVSFCMDFGIAETGIARGSPPGTTTEVLRVGFPSAENRVVSKILSVSGAPAPSRWPALHIALAAGSAGWWACLVELLRNEVVADIMNQIQKPDTRITYIANSKTRSKEKIKSYNQIKMCTCVCIMDMVSSHTRRGMGASYYHIYDECCGDGNVDTRPGIGASHYHPIYCDSFLHDHIHLDLL
jgi:hypothetical protein